jgi:hypothetical protein
MNGSSSSRWHSRVERVWRGLDLFPGPDQFDSPEDYLEFADAIAQLHSGLPPRLPEGLQEVRPSGRADCVQAACGSRRPISTDSPSSVAPTASRRRRWRASSSSGR